MPDDLTEIAKQTLEPVGDLVKRIAGPLADEIGDSLALLVRPYRIMLSVKMFQKTQRMLKEAGITPHAIPRRLFLPILDNASIQDDEDLHTRWAAPFGECRCILWGCASFVYRNPETVSTGRCGPSR
jgi:hypothetical protein